MILTTLTDCATTVTVTANTTCVPTALLGPTGQPWGVMAEVLSNAILYTVHSPDATPDHDAHRASAGDVFYVKPATKLRMRRDGTDACVRLQAFS